MKMSYPMDYWDDLIREMRLDRCIHCGRGTYPGYYGECPYEKEPDDQGKCLEVEKCDYYTKLED